MFSTFPALYHGEYHFGTGTTGLTYIGLGMGFVVSTLIGAPLGKRIYANVHSPLSACRLVLTIFFAVVEEEWWEG